MKLARAGLIVAVGIFALPMVALAQPKTQPAKDNKPSAEPAKPAAPAEEKELTLEPEGEEPAANTPSGTEGLDDICKIDPSACPAVDLDKAAARPLDEKIYAVQQIYALRYHRFELNPYFGLTMNDQFVQHPGPGLSVNWYLTNVFAIGLNGNWYGGLNSNSDFNFQTSRAARIGEPITEYQWNGNLNFSYVPAYGKFSGFGDFIFHYDFYVVGGIGAISTRPIAVVDPDNRTFEFEPKLDFHVGSGVRVFFNRWFAATLEISDYVFFDKLENPSIAEGYDSSGKPNAQDQSTWLADETSFTNNVQAQLGVSVFLPFSWEYRLPK